MKAVRVQRLKAEDVRRFAERIGAKDRSRLVVCKGEYVEIPILDGFERFFEGYDIVEQENPLFARKNDLFEILKDEIPRDLWDLIPRRYKIIGDVVMIKIPEELEEYKKKVGEAILRIHKRCKSVWRDLGREGMIRKPKVELIAGSGSETIHRENGCLFKLDVTKVMFSVGNQGERMRIVNVVQDGEVVLDMFAGIGYFTIPIAVHTNARRIYSIEINPESYFYLIENIRLNRVNNVIPILGDSMNVTPEGFAERVVMGHIFCHEFLPVAVKSLRSDGYIHYHESVPEVVIDRPIERIRSVCESLGREVRIENFRKVKNYSPGVLHVVVDAYIY
ncbi:MAG: class I SAM-dependent methyltransferase family protein [Archaeoglobales archaeon]|nr:MAG: class I SAM-dependent methyltransferase family protein [Archaeoglobales archaeon]